MQWRIVELDGVFYLYEWRLREGVYSRLGPAGDWNFVKAFVNLPAAEEEIRVVTERREEALRMKTKPRGRPRSTYYYNAQGKRLENFT